MSRPLDLLGAQSWHTPGSIALTQRCEGCRWCGWRTLRNQPIRKGGHRCESEEVAAGKRNGGMSAGRAGQLPKGAMNPLCTLTRPREPVAIQMPLLYGWGMCGDRLSQGHQLWRPCNTGMFYFSVANRPCILSPLQSAAAPTDLPTMRSSAGAPASPTTGSACPRRYRRYLKVASAGIALEVKATVSDSEPLATATLLAADIMTPANRQAAGTLSRLDGLPPVSRKGGQLQ